MHIDKRIDELMALRPVEDRDEIERRSIELGRDIFRSNGNSFPISQLQSTLIIEWLKHERTKVERYGRCSSGCDDTEQIMVGNCPEPVCPNTLLPCEARNMKPLLDLLGVVNG